MLKAGIEHSAFRLDNFPKPDALGAPAANSTQLFYWALFTMFSLVRITYNTFKIKRNICNIYLARENHDMK